MHRRQRHVIHDSQMIEQIKMLEYHTNIFTDLIDVRMPVRHIMPIDDDLSACGRLQLVQTAQQRGFPAPGRSEKHDHLAFCHIQIDVLQNLQLSEIFPQICHMDLTGASVQHPMMQSICHGSPSSQSVLRSCSES